MSVTFSNGFDEVTMKSPSYGDSIMQNDNFKFFIMMDQSVSSYKKEKTLNMLLNFVGVTRSNMDEFISFYKANIGTTIYYTDQLNNMWSGLILNNPLETTVTRGAGSCELVDFTLQLQVTDIADFVALVDDAENELVDADDNILIAY